jgi:hypothetical protein
MPLTKTWPFATLACIWGFGGAHVLSSKEKSPAGRGAKGRRGRKGRKGRKG